MSEDHSSVASASPTTRGVAATPSDETCLWVCQGPPRCNFQGDDAVAEQMAGCVWCSRIYIDESGNERTEGPGGLQ